jgi:hypothetical protein
MKGYFDPPKFHARNSNRGNDGPYAAQRKANLATNAERWAAQSRKVMAPGEGYGPTTFVRRTSPGGVAGHGGLGNDVGSRHKWHY